MCTSLVFKKVHGKVLDDSHLLSLNLDNNDIGSLGVSEIARGLANNTNLNALKLSGNRQIGDKGAEHIAKALAKNSTLSVLNIGGANIGDTGAILLAEALAENTSLTNVGLAANKIGDRGASILADLIDHDSNVKINMAWNDKIIDQHARLERHPRFSM